MARESAIVEVNKFNAGLVTDASPLTSPDNSSLAEENMVLNKDGSRNRRLGMDYEEGYLTISTSVTTGNNIAHTSFTWRNAGGISDRHISVIQFGNELKFFDLASRPVSGNLIHTQILGSVSNFSQFSYTSVDGVLVVVNPEEKRPFLFQIENNTITLTRQVIKIRDLFGVEDVIGGIDLYETSGLQTRPSSITQAHRYNLRNQGWGIPRAAASGGGSLGDPISRFRSYDGRYPSNADTVVQSLYADPNLTPRTLERFFPQDLSKNPVGSTLAAQGFFIIDALERGASRITEDASNRANYSQISGSVTSLPEDRTPGGASVVAEYGGRVWYGGFSGDVVGGDDRSPRMSSYVLFSKLVKNISAISECYQEGDPTSKDFPDIVDTDGGFIRVNGAYGINKMVNLGDSLIILATNGIWRITGTSDNGFTATQFRVEKISDRGSINPNSAVAIDNSIIYWSDDGIYAVRSGELGDWVAESISINKIQRLYDDISEDSKLVSIGAYDPYDKKVRWLYDNGVNNVLETKELVLDLVLQAFYINTIKSVGSGGPKVVSVINAIPWQLLDVSEEVMVGDEEVLVGIEDVVIALTDRTDVLRGELSYITAIPSNDTIEFTFSNYTDADFIDWKSYDGIGVDAEAFLITSYLSGTDFQRNKQVPYLTVHLRRTEVGYNISFEPLLPSSCLTQVRWDWSNSTKSGKWGREFQAYRYRRPYIPVDSDDDHNDGFSTVITKNKLRGSGKVLSIRFRTEPGKDLHLYGWSMMFSVAGNV